MTVAKSGFAGNVQAYLSSNTIQLVKQALNNISTGTVNQVGQDQGIKAVRTDMVQIPPTAVVNMNVHNNPGKPAAKHSKPDDSHPSTLARSPGSVSHTTTTDTTVTNPLVPTCAEPQEVGMEESQRGGGVSLTKESSTDDAVQSDCFRIAQLNLNGWIRRFFLIVMLTLYLITRPT